MRRKRYGSIGHLTEALGTVKSGALPPGVDPAQHRRKLVADLCKLLGPEGTVKRPAPVFEPPPLPMPDAPGLSPRTRQTLERLLAGDSEKQIAARLGVSRHTIHVYVKALYKGFDVCSRGELLAKFVNRKTIEG